MREWTMAYTAGAAKSIALITGAACQVCKGGPSLLFTRASELTLSSHGMATFQGQVQSSQPTHYVTCHLLKFTAAAASTQIWNYGWNIFWVFFFVNWMENFMAIEHVSRHRCFREKEQKAGVMYLWLKFIHFYIGCEITISLQQN